mmetsp:Transcript_34931/g.73983  ORF Transcript_34931/g.73983 Transcript_34931/m.73983 type:complete len:324 (+) Transcript_34931:1204-2175(+)
MKCVWTKPLLPFQWRKRTAPILPCAAGRLVIGEAAVRLVGRASVTATSGANPATTLTVMEQPSLTRLQRVSATQSACLTYLTGMPATTVAATASTADLWRVLALIGSLVTWRTAPGLWRMVLLRHQRRSLAVPALAVAGLSQLPGVLAPAGVEQGRKQEVSSAPALSRGSVAQWRWTRCVKLLTQARRHSATSTAKSATGCKVPVIPRRTPQRAFLIRRLALELVCATGMSADGDLAAPPAALGCGLGLRGAHLEMPPSAAMMQSRRQRRRAIQPMHALSNSGRGTFADHQLAVTFCAEKGFVFARCLAELVIPSSRWYRSWL